MTNIVKKIIRKYGAQCWALGFVRGGMDAIMHGEKLEMDWVKMPKDRWFADPFVLDVSSNEIQLLVEDYPYSTQKGMISLLKIDRETMAIRSRKVLLELPTHLSFPNILRKDGHIYVYPENAYGNRCALYEYDANNEQLVFHSIICNDAVWDSCLSDQFGDNLLFTAAHDDYHLDIYRLNENNALYESWKVIDSEKPNCRLGGALFEYQGAWYYPAQDCSKGYGSGMDIKKIERVGDDWLFTTMARVDSPHDTMRLGCHTLNTYKDIVVIDVYGYRYKMGAIISFVKKIKDTLKK